MSYEHSENKLVLGYFDEDGEFVEVNLEDVSVVQEEKDIEYEVFSELAKEYFKCYSAFLDAGFDKNQAFWLTRNLFNSLSRGLYDND